MRPLVIVPGWGHGRESWEPLVHSFAPRELHVIELPGFGSEPPPRGAWGVPQYAAWVRERLAPFEERGFDLLGHSMGGRVAAHLASEGVRGLHTLILYGAPVLYRPSVSVRARGFAAKALKPILAPLVSAGALSGGELKEAEQRGMGEIFKKVVPFDQSATLPRIEAPTLLLWGEGDEAVSLGIAKEAHALIKGSELLALPGLGHNAHIENATLFAGAVNRYLAAHESTP